MADSAGSEADGGEQLVRGGFAQEVHGKGRFSDARLNDATQFPIAAKFGSPGW